MRHPKSEALNLSEERGTTKPFNGELRVAVNGIMHCEV